MKSGPRATQRALSTELVEFVESGVSIQVGSRDDRLIPDGIRAFGARVERGRREVTVFLSAATSATTVANLRQNGLIAVCFSRILDHRSIQLKGTIVKLEPGEPSDRAVVEKYRSKLLEGLSGLGLPTRITLRLNVWPCFAARFKVESVFVQTPGPGAGAPLDVPDDSTNGSTNGPTNGDRGR